MDMKSALNNAGFSVGDIEIKRDFESFTELPLPYVVDWMLPDGVMYWMLRDDSELERSRKPVDIDVLKSKYKPVDFDPIYAWVLRNSGKCAFVSVLNTRYGYTNFEMCIKWNPYTHQYEVPGSEGKWSGKVSVAKRDGNLIELLDEFARESIYVPVVLDSYEGNIRYAEQYDRSDRLWVRGINILESTEKGIVAIRNQYKISKYGKYVIKKGRKGLYIVHVRDKVYEG